MAFLNLTIDADVFSRTKIRHLVFLHGYCSTVQGHGFLDWFEVDLGFTELFLIQTDLCVMCVFLDGYCSTVKCFLDLFEVECVLVLYSPVSFSSCPF